MGKWLVKDTLDDDYADQNTSDDSSTWKLRASETEPFVTKLNVSAALRWARTRYGSGRDGKRFKLIQLVPKGRSLRTARIAVLSELSARICWGSDNVSDIERVFDGLMQEVRSGEWPKGAK